MAEKITIGVVFGGRSGEHEVSLMSARSVVSALDPGKYKIVQIGITHTGIWLTGDDVLNAMFAGNLENLSTASILPDLAHRGLYRIREIAPGEVLEYVSRLDLVFPVLHGTYGEDGCIQGLFEVADLAYVGAGVLGSSVGMDKAVFKTIMRAEGIPLVDWLLVSRHEIEMDVQKIVNLATEKFSFPMFVKPANLGSSVGITRCSSPSDLIEGLLEAARFDRRILVERGIPDPREIEVSVLGNNDPQVSVPGEIIPSREFYSYEAKYIDGTSGLLIPAPIPNELAHKVQEIAIKAYRAIDCAGMARVDFLMERVEPGSKKQPELYLSELNTIPGFTQISMYSKLWEACGVSYPALVDRLVELALERKDERDHTERRFRSVNQDVE